jgi:hypothetical protein
LPGHDDAESLLGRDEVVDVFGSLVDVDLDPADSRGEAAGAGSVVVADGVALSVMSVVSSPEKIIGWMASTRPWPTSSPSS